MPMGRYDLLDNEDAVRGSEEFRCAPGPMGWRYFSTIVWDEEMMRVDVSVDAGWRPVRIRIEKPEHQVIIAVRGAVASVLWDDEQFELPAAPVASHPSPGFLVAAVRACTPGAETDAISIDPLTLRPTQGRMRLDEVAVDEQVPTPVGIFSAAHMQTGGRSFWLAGDVIVAGPALTLAAYDKGGAGPVPQPLRPA